MHVNPTITRALIPFFPRNNRILMLHFARRIGGKCLKDYATAVIR